jgi:hypothetical protein
VEEWNPARLAPWLLRLTLDNAMLVDKKVSMSMIQKKLSEEYEVRGAGGGGGVQGLSARYRGAGVECRAWGVWCRTGGGGHYIRHTCTYVYVCLAVPLLQEVHK